MWLLFDKEKPIKEKNVIDISNLYSVLKFKMITYWSRSKEEEYWSLYGIKKVNLNWKSTFRNKRDDQEIWSLYVKYGVCVSY